MMTSLSRQTLGRLRSGLLVLMAASATEAHEAAPCERITVEQVGTILGRVVKAKPEGSTVCRFHADRMFAEVGVTHADSGHKAIALFGDAIRSKPAGLDEDLPLHGVGTEARYRRKGQVHSVIARIGMDLIVVRTDGSREAAVALARAVGAHAVEDDARGAK